jgi:hypothetical protein
MSWQQLSAAYKSSEPIKKLPGVIDVSPPEVTRVRWSAVVTIKGDHAGLLALATLHESGAHEIILDHCEGVDASEFGFHVYVLWDDSADFREGIGDVIGMTRMTGGE